MGSAGATGSRHLGVGGGVGPPSSRRPQGCVQPQRSRVGGGYGYGYGDGYGHGDGWGHGDGA
jgi:hypothetical protein